jgi:hypothetical protein
MEPDSPIDAIEPSIMQDALRTVGAGQGLATALPPRAPDFEYVRKIGLELHCNRRFDRLPAEVRHAEVFEAGASPEDAGPEQMDFPALHSHHIAAADVGICEIGRECHVIGADRRAQKQRTPAAQQ